MIFICPKSQYFFHIHDKLNLQIWTEYIIQINTQIININGSSKF
jgi:hypothetical protein